MKTHHVPNGKRAELHQGRGGFYCPNQWILLKFVFLWQFSEMKKNQWERWRVHVWKAMFQCQGLSFQSSLPECAGSAICRELKAKTALAEEPFNSRNLLFLFFLASYFLLLHFVPVTPFTDAPCAGISGKQHYLDTCSEMEVITSANQRWTLKATS